MGWLLVYLISALAGLAGLFLLIRKVAGRGPQEFDVPHFKAHVYDSDPGPFVRDIQRDAHVPHGPPGRGDPLADAMVGLVGVCRLPSHDGADLPAADLHAAPGHSMRDKVLILSGGGQWGAYGAGLFHTLSDRSGNGLAMRNVRVITGVSTGSLQLLLLLVALDETQSPELRGYAISRLVWGYSPAYEREIVRNTGMLAMPLYGSQAGTGPLRRRIREAIYPGGDPRLVEAIGRSSIKGFIGFVEANCGMFHYVDVAGLVNGAACIDDAVEALVAASMASSAMPVFHQQMRIRSAWGTRALYDGGVRRSVFFEGAVREMNASICALVGLNSQEGALAYADLAPEFFVVRNGPTVRGVDSDLDRKDGPLLNGKRAYDLLVNESEIGAIAGLRLLNPYGRIFVTSADQWDGFCNREGDCTKGDEMFKPGFMACLRDLGRHKVEREGGPWWPLRSVDRR